MFKYYVYAYINKNTGLPYYIGKGSGNRAYAKHLHVSVPKDKSKIIFLEKNLSEVGSLALERRYIQWYGRKYIEKGGTLLNRFSGGEGGCTLQHIEYMKTDKNPMKTLRVNKGTFKKGHIPKKDTLLTRDKKRLSKVGDKNPMYGNKEAANHLHKEIKCEHCSKLSIIGNYYRWHGDNCKVKVYNDKLVTT